MSQEICGCSYVQEIQSCSYVLSTGPNSVDGTNPAPVEVVGAFSIIPGFYTSRSLAGFLPTVLVEWYISSPKKQNPWHDFEA